ncbi:MAG TPA: aminotransferase class V-fold PLP-dependent enzyme [Gemmatimonadales bacterium]|nr:aminotransferase class V-fold PLP-dependent enzyme [Gemmatimonadales bacterium]
MTPPDVLDAAVHAARTYLASLPSRPVAARASLQELRAALGGPLPLEGTDAARVVTELARDADAGIVATAGPRYFGFVVGGSLPAALATDWLVSTWDQNAGIYVLSPAASVVEEVAVQWLLELFGLPATASIGFVTGCQMANATCLAAARNAVLRKAGWDVEQQGLYGAPEIDVVVGGEAHITIFAALRYLGLGAARVRTVPADGQGRMRPDKLREALAGTIGPVIVCAQAGNVNTGAFDPIDEIATITRERGAWLHVDGAFGLWAASSPTLKALTKGLERADSWATDAHKSLNVPYDSGIAIVADPEVHRAAMTSTAAYIVKAADDRRDPDDWTPEFSRRARGFAVYAAIKALGRRGVSEMIERSCAEAKAMAERLRQGAGVEILNDVVYNQVLVRFLPVGGGDPDAHTRVVIDRVQQDGTCWLAGTTWQGKGAMRISVSGWNTTDDDIARSADAILKASRGPS